MPTIREQILSALLARLETVPNAMAKREAPLPETVPAGGLIILRDGDPGDPEVVLSPVTYLWEPMSDLTTYISLNVKGDAAHKVAGLEQGFQRLSTRGEAHMGALSRSMGVAGRAVDGLANRYTALLSGAAGVGAGKMVGDLNTEMMKLKLNAGASSETMDAFKARMFEVARLPHVSLDPSELLAAVAEIVERTGDLDYAIRNIEGIGIATRATFSRGAEIGGMTAELTKFGAEVDKSFAILKAQGDVGARATNLSSSSGLDVDLGYTVLGP